MAIEITVPALGESVTEATVGQWFKKPGEAVAVDEPLVELETDKVTLEVPAPAAGVLADIKVPQGDHGRRRRACWLHRRAARRRRPQRQPAHAAAAEPAVTGCRAPADRAAA